MVDQVDQWVGLIAEQLQYAGDRAVAEGRVQARFRQPNSTTDEPETIAAWPRASRARRTAITQPPSA